MGSLENLRRGNPGNRGGGRHSDEFIRLLRENNMEAALEIQRRLSDPCERAKLTLEQLATIFDKGAKYTHGVNLEICLSDEETVCAMANLAVAVVRDLAPSILDQFASAVCEGLFKPSILELCEVEPGEFAALCLAGRETGDTK